MHNIVHNAAFFTVWPKLAVEKTRNFTKPNSARVLYSRAYSKRVLTISSTSLISVMTPAFLLRHWLWYDSSLQPSTVIWWPFCNVPFIHNLPGLPQLCNAAVLKKKDFALFLLTPSLSFPCSVLWIIWWMRHYQATEVKQIKVTSKAEKWSSSFGEAVLSDNR